MVKFPEAQTRLEKNMFVCKDCKKKFRAPQMKVLAKKISCRGCKGKALRTMRKK